MVSASCSSQAWRMSSSENGPKKPVIVASFTIAARMPFRTSCDPFVGLRSHTSRLTAASPDSAVHLPMSRAWSPNFRSQPLNVVEPDLVPSCAHVAW